MLSDVSNGGFTFQSVRVPENGKDDDALPPSAIITGCGRHRFNFFSSRRIAGVVGSSRAKLLARVCRRFEVVEEILAIGPLRVPFARVKDADKVLDDVVAEEDLRDRLAGRKRDEDELHLPYWAELWDSATGVSEFIVRDHLARSHKMIELGRRGPHARSTSAAAWG